MIVANVVPRPPRTEMVKQDITSKGASDRMVWRGGGEGGGGARSDAGGSVYISIYSGVRSDRGNDYRLGLKTSVT